MVFINHSFYIKEGFPVYLFRMTWVWHSCFFIPGINHLGVSVLPMQDCLPTNNERGQERRSGEVQPYRERLSDNPQSNTLRGERWGRCSFGDTKNDRPV